MRADYFYPRVLFSFSLYCRATVLETPDTWYMDDSNLVLNMCQDPKAEDDDQGPVLAQCGACDEAKYEVTFEGLWSRNTHPKVIKTESN